MPDRYFDLNDAEDVTVEVQVTNTTGTATGFSDPNGIYPEKRFRGISSVAQQARHGGETVDIQGSNGFVRINNFGDDADVTDNYHNRTPAGHVIEMNDTSGNQRILFKHSSGDTLINMCPNGNLIVKSKSKVDIINGDHDFSAENGVITYKGNLTLNVKGDFKVNVDGEYKVNSQDRTEVVKGPFKTTVYGNKSDIVDGNVARQVTGMTTQTSLNGYNNIVKGDSRHTIQGNLLENASGTIDFTADTEINIASKAIRQAAKELRIFGSTGTIGGESLIYYAKNYYGTSATFTAGVTAPTFHGALEGNAKTATEAGRAGTAGSLGAGGSAGSEVNVATDTTETAQPTAANVTNYLTKYAIKKVTVDAGDVIKNNINLAAKQGNVTNQLLTAQGVRARMRDSAHRSNGLFISFNQSKGTLDSNYANPLPPEVGRIRSTKKVIVKGSTALPGANTEAAAKRIIRNIVPVRNFRPSTEQVLYLGLGLTSGTILSGNIRAGRFLAAEAYQATVPQLVKAGVSTEQVGRNLGHHAFILNEFNKNKTNMYGFELSVIEGVYIPYSLEQYTVDGPLDKARTGRRVVYEVRDENGMNLEKTFEAAYWLAANVPFGELILDYDTYEGTSKLNAQIIIEIPDIPADYNVVFNKKVRTFYNNILQSTNELTEILPS